MCFELTPRSKEKIAKKDILCWKLLEADNSPLYGRNIDRYIIGIKNPKVRIKPVSMEINKGYHSCKTRKRLIELEPSWCAGQEKLNIRRFVIPKGTRYYENATEYVSETIIMIK